MGKTVSQFPAKPWMFLCGAVVAALLAGLWVYSRDDTPIAVSTASPELTITPPADAASQPLGTERQSPDRPKPQDLAKSKALVFDESLCHAATSSSVDKTVFMVKMQRAKLESSAEIDRLMARAVAAPDPVQRAAAQFVQADSLEATARAAYEKQHPDCKQSQECQIQARAAGATAFFPLVDAVAQQAIYATDPQLYALAFHACQRQADPTTGFCAQISAVQWAQRDPSNGTAWLYVASHASQNQRGSEFNEAMFRFSRASKFDMGLSPLSQLQRSDAMQSDNVTVAPAVVQLVENVFTNIMLPHYKGVMDYCQPTALNDPNRKLVCNDIATKMARDEPSVVGRTLGLKLGERLGWIAAEMDPVREELDAYLAMTEVLLDNMFPSAGTSGGDQDLNACIFTVRMTKHSEDRMRLGELGAMRLQMKAQPMTRHALAEEFRAKKRRPTEKRASQASAVQVN